jgi:IS5 family transposase
VKPPKKMLGDKAYDSAELRADLNQRGTKPIIPNRCNRKQPFSSASVFTSCAGASRAPSTG